MKFYTFSMLLALLALLGCIGMQVLECKTLFVF